MIKEDNTLYVIDPSETMEDKECREYTLKEFDNAWELLKDSPENNPKQGLVLSGKALGYVFPHRKHDSKGKEIPPTPEEAIREAEMQEKEKVIKYQMYIKKLHQHTVYFLELFVILFSLILFVVQCQGNKT